MLNPKQEYFNAVAPRWDRVINTCRVADRLSAQLALLGIRPSERIVDLGCGTGTSTGLLAQYMTDGGVLWGVDFSEAMVLRAQAKVLHDAVRWTVARAEALPFRDRSMDRVICFSAWPHFSDDRSVARELWRVLTPGGHLNVLHIDARECINSIHSGIGGAIGHDLLPPAAELATLLERLGFRVDSVVDSAEEYIVDAVRAPAADGGRTRAQAKKVISA